DDMLSREQSCNDGCVDGIVELQVERRSLRNSLQARQIKLTGGCHLTLSSSKNLLVLPLGDLLDRVLRHPTPWRVLLRWNRVRQRTVVPEPGNEPIRGLLIGVPLDSC